jgi:hypothetical protein
MRVPLLFIATDDHFMCGPLLDHVAPESVLVHTCPEYPVSSTSCAAIITVPSSDTAELVHTPILIRSGILHAAPSSVLTNKLPYDVFPPIVLAPCVATTIDPFDEHATDVQFPYAFAVGVHVPETYW